MTRGDSREERRANPFDGGLARPNSSYAALRGGRLVRVSSGEPLTPLAGVAHDSFRAFVLDPEFSCVGAKSAIRRGGYRVGVYGDLDTPGSTAGLARDLFSFVEDRDEIGGRFRTFVALFTGPGVEDEAHFERLLWAQLQHLHEENRLHHEWSPSFGPDPEGPDFAFGFAGQAFFVVGLNPRSSRRARRFAWPTLVFNPSEQFERIREGGKLSRMQKVIRARELSLQGTLNPNLGALDALPEARQYSGRPVEEGWACPFRPAGTQTDKEIR